MAKSLRDPVVDAHPELELYGTHSKRLVVRGRASRPDGTSSRWNLRAASVQVIEARVVALELKQMEPGATT